MKWYKELDDYERNTVDTMLFMLVTYVIIALLCFYLGVYYG